MPEIYDEKYTSAPEKTIQFDQINRQISSTYICPICEGILIEPTQTECGCRFCHRCITDRVNSGNLKCPICDSHISKDQFLKDKAIEKEIFSIPMRCLHDGCDNICSWKDLRGHLDICGYRREQCDKCQQTYLNRAKDEHFSNQCQKILVKCNECGLEMTKEDLETKHRNIEMGLDTLCPNLRVPCPYKCDDVDNIHDNIKAHLIECNRRPISCPLKDLGCVVVGTKDDISIHLRTQSFQHQILMMSEINRLRNENDNLNKSFQSINETIMKEINKLKEINNELIGNVEKLKLREMENSKEIGNCKSEIDRYKQSIVNQPITKENDGISVIGGECTWTIGDIRRKCLEARDGGRTQFISGEFYISRPGYKMCMKLYPNGDGQGQGVFLSVYFVIVKGEYDDDVSWPFKDRVKMSIVSSNNASPDITILMRPDNNDSCYGKPISGTNIGAGQPKFLKLSELLNHDNYIHGHSLILKLKI